MKDCVLENKISVDIDNKILMTHTENIILQEKFDASKLAYIIDHEEKYKQQMIEAGRYWEDNDYTPWTQLRQYHNTEGIRLVEYEQRNGGRMFVKKAQGLQSLAREFRHTISGDFYNDIDMVNAHPVILQHLCKNNDIKCPMLDEYVSNRENILSAIYPDRCKGKQLILKLTNGGGKADDIKNQWVDKYEAEMIGIHNAFAELNPTDFNQYKNNKNKTWNIKGSYMNILLCRFEHVLLMSIWQFLGKPDNAVLCFDGIMIPKYMEFTLMDIENHIFQNHNINIKLSVKPMDSGLVVPSKKEMWNEKKVTPAVDKDTKIITVLLESPHSDEDYAEAFVKLFDNMKWYNGAIYQFKNRWTRDHDGDSFIYEFLGSTLYNRCRKVLDRLYKDISKAKIHAEISKALCRLRSRSGRAGIVESIKPKITTKDDLWDLNPYLLGFNNGVYDLKTHVFRDGQLDDYVSFTTGYDYAPHNAAEIQQLLPFINQILPDSAVKDYLLKALSTGLYGKTIQQFFVLTGEGSNGKDTLISKLFAKTLGTDYYYNADNTIITEKRKGGGPNVGVASMNKKRFVLYSEPSKNSTLQGGIIKELTGCDSINARGLYSNDTVTHLKSTSFCLCNDIPQIDHIDGGVARRLRVIPFDSLFKTEDEIKTYKNTDNIFPINAYYDSDEFRNKFKLTLFHLLIGYFKVFQDEGYIMKHEPQRIKNLSAGYLEDCDDFIGWFKDNYEKANADEYLKIKDVFNEFKISTYYANLNKKDKRSNNKSRFVEKIRKHPMLRGHYVDRYQPYTNGGRLCIRNVLTGFKIKRGEPDENHADIIDEAVGMGFVR